MNSAELIARIRLNTGWADTEVDYPDSVILSEINDSFQTTFEKAVLAVRNGYWCGSETTTITSGRQKYRIPHRAAAGALEKVEIGYGSPPSYCLLEEVTEAEASLYERPSNILGAPRAYVIRKDQVVILPVPDAGAYTLRIWYYLRPSRLVTQQSTTLFSGTVRGLITARDPVARTITVNVVPFDMEAVAGGVITPAAITSGNQRIDVVHPNGWHELALTNATQTLAGSVFTVGGSDDMSEIEVGDYVRAAGQTDWPALSEDFHRCLADTTSIKMLQQKQFFDKAAGFASSTNADYERFKEIIQPRAKSSGITVRAPLPGLRGAPSWPWYPG